MTIQVSGSCILFSDSSVQTSAASANTFVRSFPQSSSISMRLCDCASPYCPDISVCNYYQIRMGCQNFSIPCIVNAASGNKLGLDVKASGVYCVILPTCFVPNILCYNSCCTTYLYEQANSNWFLTTQTCGVNSCPLAIQGDKLYPIPETNNPSCLSAMFCSMICACTNPYYCCCGGGTGAFGNVNLNSWLCSCGLVRCCYTGLFGCLMYCQTLGPNCNLTPNLADATAPGQTCYNALGFSGTSVFTMACFNSQFFLIFGGTGCDNGTCTCSVMVVAKITQANGTCTLAPQAVVPITIGSPCSGICYCTRFLTLSASQNFIAVHHALYPAGGCQYSGGPQIGSSAVGCIQVYNLCCFINGVSSIIQTIPMYSIACNINGCAGCDIDSWQNAAFTTMHDLDKCTTPLVYSYFTGCATLSGACYCCAFVQYKLWKGTGQLCYTCCSVPITACLYTSSQCQTHSSLFGGQCGGGCIAACKVRFPVLTSYDGQYTFFGHNGSFMAYAYCGGYCSAGTLPCCPHLSLYIMRDCIPSCCTASCLSMIWSCTNLNAAPCYCLGCSMPLAFADCCLCHIMIVSANGWCSTTTCNASYCQQFGQGIFSRNTAGTGYVNSMPHCMTYGCLSNLALSVCESGNIFGFCNELCCLYAAGFNGYCCSYCTNCYGLKYNAATCCWTVDTTCPFTCIYQNCSAGPCYLSCLDIRIINRQQSLCDNQGTLVDPFALHALTTTKFYSVT